MKLKAAYFIQEVIDFCDESLHTNLKEVDEVKPFQSIKELIKQKFSGYHLNNIEERELTPTPIQSVIFNFFSRGIPTRCTFKCEEYLLNKFSGYRDNSVASAIREQIFGNQGEEVYLKNYKLLKLLELPILIGQIHKTLALICIICPKETINVFTDLVDEDLANHAVDEFNEVLQAFINLITTPYNKRINLTEQVNADYKLLKSDYNLIDGIDNKFSNNNKVHYKDYGEQTEYADEAGEVISRFEVKDKEMHESLVLLLKNTFRFEGFKPGQQSIIRRILLKKDVIGLLPTGGGKSLCYQLCGLLQPGLTVVVDPINSLMKDQELKLHEHGINQSVFINSLLPYKERDLRLENISNGRYLFLFISPERFHIVKYRSALEAAKKNGTKFHYVVIDEAHVVSEWYPSQQLHHNILNPLTRQQFINPIDGVVR